MKIERPEVVEIVSWAAGNGDRSENGDYQYGKRRLREIDSRIHFLTTRLEEAEVVDPMLQPAKDKVYFGASVTYATQEGKEKTVTVVGVDEADYKFGEISVQSPIAKAVLGKRVGDEVVVVLPSGREIIEIISISYHKKK